MVPTQEAVGPIVLDDRVVLPPREKMDPKFKEMCDDIYDALAKKHGWKNREKTDR